MPVAKCLWSAGRLLAYRPLRIGCRHSTIMFRLVKPFEETTKASLDSPRRDRASREATADSNPRARRVLNQGLRPRWRNLSEDRRAVRRGQGSCSVATLSVQELEDPDSKKECNTEAAAFDRTEMASRDC